MAPPHASTTICKKRLVQYSLDGHHGTGEGETEEDDVGGTGKETEQEEVSDWPSLVGES